MSVGGKASLGPFPATQWSPVARAEQNDSPASRQALETLLIRYLPALRAHLLLEKRMPRDQVEDLLQGFTANIVEPVRSLFLSGLAHLDALKSTAAASPPNAR